MAAGCDTEAENKKMSDSFWDDGHLVHVQKYQDGDINCYVLASGAFNAPTGISCANSNPTGR